MLADPSQRRKTTRYRSQNMNEQPEMEISGMERRDHALDGLRGIAALLVFFSHVGMMTWWPAPDSAPPTTTEYALWHLGAPSVDLFFVLSGYVLAGSLERTRLDESAIAAFCARRWVRLMPVAWAGMLIGLIVKTWIVPLQVGPLVGMIKMAEPLDWKDVVGMITFVAPMPETERFNVPLWSLLMEMYASLLIPVMVAGLRTQGKFFLLIAFLCPIIPWYATERLEFMTLPLFVLGVAIRTYVPPMPARSALPALCIALMLVFSRHIIGEMGFYHRYLSGVGAALLVLSVHAGAARRFLTSYPVAWLGRVSYPFYAVHYPILLAGAILLSARGVQTNLAAVAALPVALVCAEIVRRTIERPSIALSRRVGADRLGRPAT